MKKVSRRSFLKVAGAVASVSALAACGTPSDVSSSSTSAADSSASTEASSTASGEKTIINVWTMQRHDMDFVTPILEEFNATNDKNIEVVFEIMTENYDSNLDLSFQSNQSPDLYRVAGIGIYPYIEKGQIIPLDDYVTDEMREDFGETLYSDTVTSVDGVLYTVPYAVNPYRYVYNKDIFRAAGLDPEAPPTNMDQMLEYAKIITEKLSGEGIYGICANLKNPSSALGRSLDRIADRSGVGRYNRETKQYDFTGLFKAVDYYAQMYQKGYFFPGAEGLDIDPMRAQFAAGSFAMYISADWEVGVYNTQFPTEVDWAAAPIPTLVEGDIHPSYVANGAGWAISSQSKNPDAAWEVMQIFNSTDYQTEYASLGLGFMLNPVASANATTPDVYGAEYFKLTENDQLLPLVPDQMGLVVEGELYLDVAGSVIFGDKTSEEAVADLNERYNKALEEARANGATF